MLTPDCRKFCARLLVFAEHTGRAGIGETVLSEAAETKVSYSDQLFSCGWSIMMLETSIRFVSFRSSELSSPSESSLIFVNPFWKPS